LTSLADAAEGQRHIKGSDGPDSSREISVLKASRAFIGVLALFACVGPAASASAATTIGAEPDPDIAGPFQAQCYWSAGAPTFGQTITVPEGDNVLDRFSFYLVENHNTVSGAPLGPQTVTYKAYVYEWDEANNRAVGPRRWESSAPQVVNTSTTIQEVVAETGGVELESGVQYIAFFSISETLESNDPDAGGCFMRPATWDPYGGGSWEFAVNGADTWTEESWPLSDSGDVAFSATFSAPAPPDGDADGVADDSDNCPTVSNSDQLDNDADGIGNACDPTPDPDPEPIYAFEGFFAPVNNKDAQGNYVLNAANAGSAIPLKFRLGGDYGLDVFEAGYPKSQVIACDSQAEVDGIEETVTAGGSSLSYAADSNTYIYVWKTEKAWEDTCRQLVVKFDDGTTARASFKFR
jgi:hypothetical protein